MEIDHILAIGFEPSQVEEVYMVFKLSLQIIIKIVYMAYNIVINNKINNFYFTLFFFNIL
jgi:hypothetical protein